MWNRRGTAGPTPRPSPRSDHNLPKIIGILEADKKLPKKQRHTAKRIWRRLQDEEVFDGGYTTVKDAVRELRSRRHEVFVPLVHRPGKAQVDLGHALANIGGVLRKVAFFAMVLPYSNASAPRRSGKATFGRSSSSGACRRGSAMTTAKWR